MAGVCESCGKAVERLFSCLMCGAKICSECMIPGDGCKVCQGKIRME